MNKKLKLKLIMLAPLAGMLCFFLYSSVSALITINSVHMPENFENIPLRVKNYEVYELDRESSNVKWRLNAKSAVTESGQTVAKVKDVTVKIYEENKETAIIKSDFAHINEKTKAIHLTQNVRIENLRDGSILEAEALDFKDSSNDIKVSNWTMNAQEEYTISGDKGIINKSFDSIESVGNASIVKEGFELKANQINVEKDAPIIATGKAILNLENSKSLKADKIVFNLDGTVEADGNVEVETDKISCFSNHLDIDANEDKSPRLATLTGSPYIIKDDKTIKSDVIKYDFKDDQVAVEGNVRSI